VRGEIVRRTSGFLKQRDICVAVHSVRHASAWWLMFHEMIFTRLSLRSHRICSS
jgi:hypothetical protein